MSLSVLIASDPVAFALYLAFLVAFVAFLANRPQPVPHPEHWQWIEDRTDWKKTVT